MTTIDPTSDPGIDCATLDPELYRHPGERAARARLEKIPGFGKFIDRITTNFNASAQRQAELGSMARAGAGVYPLLHALWTRVQERFGLRDIPLHLAHDAAARGEPSVALRGSNDHPVVLLDAAFAASLPEREMEAVLFAQAASVRLGNATLLAAADMMRWFLDVYGVAGAPAVLPAWGIENWRRCALFSADRAAALAAGGPEAVLLHLARISGAGEGAWGGVPDPEELRAQGLEAVARADGGAAGAGSRLMRRLVLSLSRGNSVALVRRVDLQDWFASGIPARILSGEITSPAQTEWDAASNPSAAYWGEFACCGDGEEEEAGKTGLAGIAADAATQAFGELRDSAEKGLGTLFRAGEAFWNTLTENDRK